MQYISKYSNGKKVSAAQYITEIICEHKAVRTKDDLHYRFWLSAKWEKFYKSQIGQANSLLKKYNHQAIIKALNSDNGKRIFSLRAKHLLPIIEHYETLIEKQKLNAQAKPNVNYNDDRNSQNFKFRTNKHNGIISKLKDIENGS